jgi:hypothetical protein
MERTLNRATPDELIEQGSMCAAMYEIDLSALTPETARLLVSHTFGRVGAAYTRLPQHAHYVNLYTGDGISDEVRTALFPEILGAGHSTSHQDRPQKPFSRVHGVLLQMTPNQAEGFLPGTPASVEMFEIGSTDRDVEMYGVSVAMKDASALDDYARSRDARLVWLTPRALPE